jgi:hypothetical protein
MPVQFSTNRFPIVTMAFIGKDISDMEVRQLSVQVLGLLERKRPFILITDMSQGEPTPAQGEMLTGIMDKRRDDFRRYLACNCLVITSAPTRLLIKALHLARKPPFDVRVESTLAAAERFSNGKLAELGRAV